MPNSTSSSVAALVPAWQAAGFIQPTLDCLSAQTYPNLQIVISVDLCDDETHAICVAHTARDQRFRVVQQEKRLGYVGNCNFLLHQVETSYALFAFHDDILAPDYIARLATVLDARPEVVLSYSDVLLTHADGRRELWEYSQLEGITDRVQRGLKVLQGNDKWWVPNRGLFRLAEARRINGLKTHGAGEFSADWPWLFHMSLLGEFARIPEILCHKFYQPGSLSRSWKFSPEQFFEVYVSCMREVWNSDLPGEEKLQLAVPVMNWLLKNKSSQRSKG